MSTLSSPEPRYLDKPKHPIREVLTWLCGKQPPYYVQGYDYSNLTDQQHEDLQQWAVEKIDKTPLFWSTGIAVIEAAETIVAEAVSNGNIPAKDSAWRTEGLPRSFFKDIRKKGTRKSPRRKVKTEG